MNVDTTNDGSKQYTTLREYYAETVEPAQVPVPGAAAVVVVLALVGLVAAVAAVISVF